MHIFFFITIKYKLAWFKDVSSALFGSWGINQLLHRDGQNQQAAIEGIVCFFLLISWTWFSICDCMDTTIIIVVTVLGQW
mgnify:CR=1 FL=1